MTARIHVLPSGREFTVQGHQSLLEAALQAGVAVDYGCNSGTCGQCKARIVSGQVQPLRGHDYVLTESEKATGQVLMCCVTAASDLVLDAVEAHGSEDIPSQEILTRVRKIERPRPTIAILHLRTPRTRRLRFLAGQFARLSIPTIGARNFSIASCPCDDMNLEFHVAKQPGDPFCDHVFRGLQRGDAVTLRGPKGNFTLPEGSERPIVFVACDTGFAAVKSLVENAMATDFAAPLYLYWLDCGGGGPYMDNLCRSWADAFDSFCYRTLNVRQHSFSSGAAAIAAALAPAWQEAPAADHHRVYACGPRALLRALRGLQDSARPRRWNVQFEPCPHP